MPSVGAVEVALAATWSWALLGGVPAGLAWAEALAHALPSPVPRPRLVGAAT